MDAEHNHSGPASASRYALKCRNPECLAEVRKYRKRLKARKDSGVYKNLRLADNRRSWPAEVLALLSRPGLTEDERAAVINGHTALVVMAAYAERDGRVPREFVPNVPEQLAGLAAVGLIRTLADGIYLDLGAVQ